eukprot:gene7505-8302_t
MDGISKTQLQVQNGTRPLVELLNELRIYFGCDKIAVKTPIVESRLRSGLVPARPLVLAYDTLGGVEITLTVPMGYPHANKMSGLQARCAAIVEDSVNMSPKEMMQSLLQEVTAAMTVLGVSVHETAADRRRQEGSEKEEEEVVEEEEEDLLDDRSGDDLPAFYHCRKCRYLLFDSLSLHEHSLLSRDEQQCTSFFLEEAPGYLVTDGLDAGVG